MDSGQHRLLTSGRALGWLGVALTAGAAIGSVFVLVGRLRSTTVTLAVLVVLAWMALAVVPLVFVALVAAMRLRFLAAPSLAAPGLVLVAAAVALAPVHGLLLLGPAGLMLASTGQLRIWREARVIDPALGEGVRPRL